MSTQPQTQPQTTGTNPAAAEIGAELGRGAGHLVTNLLGFARAHVRTGLKLAEVSVSGAGDVLDEVSKSLSRLRADLDGTLAKAAGETAGADAEKGAANGRKTAAN